MSRSLRFHPTALRELDEAVAFYDAESAGLGAAFIDEVERALQHIQRFPDAAPLVRGGIRRKVIAAFPYAVLYSTGSDVVVVLALAHQRRRPFYWRDRD
jgi:plasmid stabilization system protein ParE